MEKITSLIDGLSPSQLFIVRQCLQRQRKKIYQSRASSLKLQLHGRMDIGQQQKELTIFRNSTSLLSWARPRSQAAVIMAFIQTSTGTISAGKSGLQCIDRTTPVKIKIQIDIGIGIDIDWWEVWNYHEQHQWSIPLDHSCLQPSLDRVLSMLPSLFNNNKKFRLDFSKVHKIWTQTRQLFLPIDGRVITIGIWPE